jgi:hypothetical protein
VQEVHDLMSERFDVGDDWDTLFSTRILKKTGIRMAERASANTDATAGTDAAEGAE